MGCGGLRATLLSLNVVSWQEAPPSTSWRGEHVSVRPTSLSSGLRLRDEGHKLCVDHEGRVSEWCLQDGAEEVGPGGCWWTLSLAGGGHGWHEPTTLHPILSPATPHWCLTGAASCRKSPKYSDSFGNSWSPLSWHLHIPQTPRHTSLPLRQRWAPLSQSARPPATQSSTCAREGGNVSTNFATLMLTLITQNVSTTEEHNESREGRELRLACHLRWAGRSCLECYVKKDSEEALWLCDCCSSSALLDPREEVGARPGGISGADGGAGAGAI